MSHAVSRLSSRSSLPYHEALSVLSSLLPAARAASRSRRALSALCPSRGSYDHRSRIRLQTLVDGQRYHLIYDYDSDQIITFFPADPDYCGKRPPEISTLF